MAAPLRFSPITIFAFVPDPNPAKWIEFEYAMPRGMDQ
jgi:hypothetical protein